MVGLCAGWGLGNALFIATALSVIVGSASGGDSSSQREFTNESARTDSA
jgi:hypothetical protein